MAFLSFSLFERGGSLVRGLEHVHRVGKIKTKEEDVVPCHLLARFGRFLRKDPCENHEEEMDGASFDGPEERDHGSSMRGRFHG